MKQELPGRILDKTDLILATNMYLKKIFDGLRKQKVELDQETMALKMKLEKIKKENEKNT